MRVVANILFLFGVIPLVVASIMLIPPMTIIPVMGIFVLADINPWFVVAYVSCYFFALVGGYYITVFAEYLGSDYYF